MIARGFGAAALLMLIVLLLFAIARIIGGKAPGTLSSRQQKSRERQSHDDAVRMAKASVEPTNTGTP
jgi:phosphate transport system permease protein